MTTMFDAIKAKKIETAAPYDATENKLRAAILKLGEKYKLDLKQSSMMFGYRSETDSLKSVSIWFNSKFEAKADNFITDVLKLFKVGATVSTAKRKDRIVIKLSFSQETASTEIAASRKNFSKMINKIVAISQNMKLTVKDWDKIDAGVRKGLGAEKASVEVADSEADVKKVNSAKAIEARIKKGLKVMTGEDDLFPESYVKKHLKDDDVKAKITKGDNANHFYVYFDDDSNEIGGAIYKHDGKWHAFMGTTTISLGHYSTKEIAAVAVLMDYVG